MQDSEKIELLWGKLVTYHQNKQKEAEEENKRLLSILSDIQDVQTWDDWHGLSLNERIKEALEETSNATY